LWLDCCFSITIGSETHRETLAVITADLPGTDIVIGLDFFLTHRIYVSNNQERVNFTSNGVRPFR
jgi:hypothetical protein